MPPRTKKPTLADFTNHCGQCTYCGTKKDTKNDMGCYVEPPLFTHFEDEIPQFIDCLDVAVNRPACEKFKSKIGDN
jgi:hypothetical protein